MDAESLLAAIVFASEEETKIGAPGYVRAPVEVEHVVQQLQDDGLVERWSEDTDFVKPTERGRAQVGAGRMQ